MKMDRRNGYILKKLPSKVTRRYQSVGVTDQHPTFDFFRCRQNNGLYLSCTPMQLKASFYDKGTRVARSLSFYSALIFAS